MSYKKFDPADIILNTMRAAPHCEFFIDPHTPGATMIPGGTVYYNNIPNRKGKFVSNVLDVPDGFISLYEMNIDRYEDATTAPQNPLIYSFIYKDSSRYNFKTIMDGSEEEWTTSEEGEKLYATYPFSASIIREFMTGAASTLEAPPGVTGAGSYAATGAGQRKKCQPNTAVLDPDGVPIPGRTIPIGAPFLCGPVHPHYYALRQTLEALRWSSEHFTITGSLTGSHPKTGTAFKWIKDQQDINLISIPSIFYGSKIKPGTVSCKFYYTGSLIAELADTKRNGELIQVSGTYGESANIGKVAGVALYEQGFLVLTGSWDLSDDDVYLDPSSNDPVKPMWIYFGAGAQDKVNRTTVGGITKGTFPSGDPPSYVNFNLSFRGETETSVMTMFTHAKRGEANFSNNPTFIKKGQTLLQTTSSTIYEENPARVVKNIASSSFPNQSASFKRHIYISKVGIYDEAKNLIGIATLADPVLKSDEDDYTFKLRLDL